jgi:tyrosyl-tRNA synthetase
LALYGIYPILELQGKSIFLIDRPVDYGGCMTFCGYEELEQKYSERLVHPVDLKMGVREFLITFLKPLREYFNNEDKQLLIKKAYS